LDLGVSGFYPSGAIALNLKKINSIGTAPDFRCCEVREQVELKRIGLTAFRCTVSGKCKRATQIPLKCRIVDLSFLLAFGECQSNLPLPL
jgi:hypothetical protein